MCSIAFAADSAVSPGIVDILAANFPASSPVIPICTAILPSWEVVWLDSALTLPNSDIIADVTPFTSDRPIIDIKSIPLN